MLGQSLLRHGSPSGAGAATTRLLSHRPAALGSNSLWLTVGRLHPDRPGKQSPHASPRLSHHLSFQLPTSQVPLLLLEWKGFPVDEDESAEDEEHASPPQHLLALSVQHKAQGGLRDRQL